MWSRYGVAAASLLLLALSAQAEPSHMLGRQSHNVGITVVPAPGQVAIDGDLADWDLSGRIWVFADKAVRDRYSVQAVAMWDKSFLYLAAKWKDPTPMFSLIDPAFDPNDGWKSDSWQLRFRTDQVCHVTTWCFAPKKMPAAHVAFGKSLTEPHGGEGTFVVAKADGTDLGRGIEMAYRKDPDGRGYTQELKLPWSLLYKQVPELRPGLVLQIGMEFLWGDPTGKTWPIHRYADNMQPGATSREFYWTNWKAWGDATLAAAGNVPQRTYVEAAETLQGTVPVQAEIPADAARFTLVIEDAQGRRVRNLAADFDPADYTTQAEPRLVQVLWDCLDDWGSLVEPGSFTVRGLAHSGLRASYETCFYNPGTPPWDTKDGSGAWGADHAPPLGVAAAGDWMILSWAFAEGGSGLIGIGPDGLKKWGEKRGATALAADPDHVYAVISSWHVKVPTLCRFARADGSPQPFVRGGKPRPFELPIADILGKSVGGEVAAMAAGAGRLVLALSEGKLAILEAESAEPLGLFPAPDPAALAFAPDGTLYAVVGGGLCRVDIGNGARTELAVPGLGKAGPLAVDGEGRLAIADLGPDSQVKVYRPARTLFGHSKTRFTLDHTVGRKGGRPVRGPFDPQAMTHVSSIAFDSQGRLWAVESWDFPRRVSLWGSDGQLIRDYLGNTGYAGTGCTLHDQDPALGYCGPLEFQLDKASRSWRLTQVTWVPGPGESFPIDTGSHVHAQRLTSSASGSPHEYLYKHDGPQVVYVPRGGRWQPVAAVCLVGHFSGRINRNNVVEEEPSGEFAGLNAHDGVFWNDTNRDGRVQRYECTILPTDKPGLLGDERQRGEPGLPLGNGWGGRIGPDLAFYADGIARYSPIGFTGDGAPIYSPVSMEKLPIDERGDLVPVPDEHLLLCLSFKGYAGRTTGILGIDDRTGKLLWSYPNPYPGVHGSHRAPMPQPGLVIGPLKICGVAHVNDQVGRVFLLRGNLGQDYLMTTDGLLVGALFQDGRLPGDALPDREEMLAGAPMEGFSHGSEPFNGWFGKQADGVVRTTTGFAREASMILQIHGLEDIHRIRAPQITIDVPTLVKANQANIARAAEPEAPEPLAVPRLARAPKIDGDPADWQALRPITIQRLGSPNRALARLAYDDANLYALFEVDDRSPWLNEGRDITRLFKTGDAIDIQLNTDPAAPAKRTELLPGDLRIVFGTRLGAAVAVLMKPIVPGTPDEKKVRYHSPVGDRAFDLVEVIEKATVAVARDNRGYCLEAAVPLKAIGLAPKPGMTLRGDVGVISSDAQGRIDTARTYWANKQTNLVSDLPHEAWLYPEHWGELKFE